MKPPEELRNPIMHVPAVGTRGWRILQVYADAHPASLETYDVIRMIGGEQVHDYVTKFVAGNLLIRDGHRHRISDAGLARWRNARA